jgi:tetrahedral aminopeptidase
MELLKQLSEALGPSGREGNVRNIIIKEIKDFVDEVYVDKFGNLIAHKKGIGSKVMLAAHMDEIGLMVREILSNGRIKFQEVGGIEPITLVSQSAFIMGNNGQKLCNGVITFRELHEDLAIEELPDMADLYVDTGLTRDQLNKKGVNVGSYIIPAHHFKTLGNENVFSGKALDDRIGCYVMIQLIKKLKKATQNIYFVFTVQEEIGLNGSKTAVYNINPDWGIAVDTTNSEDSEDDPNISIGKGPCLTIMDDEMVSNKCLNDWLMELAKKNGIKLQPKVEDMGTTDATRIMLAKGGIPCTALNCPIRNIHSTISVADMGDVKDMIKLLEELLKNPPKICIV